MILREVQRVSIGETISCTSRLRTGKASTERIHQPGGKPRRKRVSELQSRAHERIRIDNGRTETSTLTQPSVMRLVQSLVQERDVQPSVDPVDAPIREDHKGDHTERHVRPRTIAIQRGSLEPSRSVFLNRIIEQRRSPDLSHEPRNDESRHAGHRLHRQCDLLGHLILQETRVVLQPTVEQGVIRGR